jgi:hypothetical protein
MCNSFSSGLLMRPYNLPVPVKKGQLRRILRRFVVADRSMEPTLLAGQGLLATGLGPVRAGQVRCFTRPGRQDFWLVKRVAEVYADGTMSVRADNPAGTDSRHFGPVPVAGSYRVLVALPRRLM